MECHIGIKEKFYYKKTRLATQEVVGIVNISLIESNFIAFPPPKIPGYSYFMGIGFLFVGILSIIVHRQITIRNKKQE